MQVIITNITYLLSGKASVLILGFLFNIYIAKSLGASQYGVFSTVSAFCGMFSFMIFKGYQKVVIRECAKDKEKLNSAIEGTLGTKILLSLLAMIFINISASFFNYSDETVLCIIFFSFTLLFNSISSLLRVAYHVNSKMKYIAYTEFIQKLIYIFPAGVAIWLKYGVLTLILLFTVSTLIDVFINVHIIKKYFSIRISTKNISLFNINPKLLKEAFVFSLLDFIKYFHKTIDITMLSWMLSIENVGFYAAASKLIIPLHLFGRTIRTALFPHFVKHFKVHKSTTARKLFLCSLLIILCTVPISFFIALFSEQIIHYSFGDEFSASARILKYLCWLIPLGFVSIPFNISMQANHHEKKLIIPSILRALSNVILNFILIRKYGYMGVVYSTLITFAWYHAVVGFGYQYYILKKFKNIL